jgi:hypothetical protein
MCPFRDLNRVCNALSHQISYPESRGYNSEKKCPRRDLNPGHRLSSSDIRFICHSHGSAVPGLYPSEPNRKAGILGRIVPPFSLFPVRACFRLRFFTSCASVLSGARFSAFTCGKGCLDDRGLFSIFFVRVIFKNGIQETTHGSDVKRSVRFSSCASPLSMPNHSSMFSTW